jgi:zinc protease
VSLEEVQRLAVETYGSVPANPHFDQDFGRLESVKTAVQPIVPRVILEDPRLEAPHFRRIYAVPGFGNADAGEAEALQVLTQILVRGAASRVYRKLVIEDEVATAVSGGYSTTARDTGELMLSVLAKEPDLRPIEAAVNAAVDDIRQNGISQAELRCAKKYLIADYIYRGGDQTKLAFRHGGAAAIGRTLREMEEWPAAISRVSAAEVWKVARTYLIARRSVTGWVSARRDDKRLRRAAPSGAERRLVRLV